MASLVAPVVLVAGAAFVMSVPVVALKELFEKRWKYNSKKQLSRRHVCRVNFAELDAPMKGSGMKKSVEAHAILDDGTKYQKSSPPPSYDDLFRFPPSYRSEMIIR